MDILSNYPWLAARLAPFLIAREQFDSDMEHIKVNLIALTMIGSGLQTLGFASLALILNLGIIWLPLVIWGVVELVLYGALRRSAPRVTVTHVYCLTTIACSTWIAVLTGGVLALVWMWLPAMCIWVNIAASTRVAIFWSTINVLSMAGLAVAGSMGVSFPPLEVETGLLHTMIVLNMAGVVSLVLAFTVIYAKINAWVIEQLTQREADLEVARDSVIAAASAKDQFLATMSHELRTPLNAIVGYSDMMLEDAQEDELLAPWQDDLGKVVRSARQLEGLIEAILELSQADHLSDLNAKVVVDAVDVASMVEALLATLQYELQLHHNTVQLNINDVGVVQTDGALLKQVLFHLLHNANKFSVDSTIELNVDKRQNHWRFEVVDQGIGIATEDTERIFEPFTQVDGSSTRLHDGAGVGLALASHYCRRLDGQIKVESSPGQGSTFTVLLPVVE